MEDIHISIVVPVYNGGARLLLLHASLAASLAAYGASEIIFVDDASSDGSDQVIAKMRAADPRVRLIRLRARAGQYRALFAGYACSKGRVVVSLDDDFFAFPGLLPEFIRKVEAGCDIVAGWRLRPFGKGFFSFLFNLAVSLIAGRRVHDLGCPVKAKNRKAVEALISCGEMTRFLRRYKEFSFTEIKISHLPGSGFASRYSAVRLLKAGWEILCNNFFPRPAGAGDYREDRA